MENLQKITIDIMNNKFSDYIYSKQFDAGRIVKFTLTDDGGLIDTTDTFCTFIMKVKAGVIIQTLEADLDGTFKLDITRTMTYQYGKLPYQLIISSTPLQVNPDGTIVFVDDITTIGTVDGVFLVEECVIDEETAEAQIDTDIMDQLLDTIAKAGAYITEARNAAIRSGDYAVDSLNSAEESERQAVISKSYAVGGTDYDHEGVDDDIDNSKYYYEGTKDFYNEMTKYKTVTLYKANWNNKQQTIEVPGIAEDETEQLISVMPAQRHIDYFIESGIVCIKQSRDHLTFRCETLPQTDIQVFVAAKITDLNKLDLPLVNLVYSEEEPMGLGKNDYWVTPYE